MGESTLHGAKIVVTLYYFLRIPCLNFNHIIIIKYFHNVMHIMVGQNPNNQMPMKLHYFISYGVMLEYIYTKKYIYVITYLKNKYNKK